MALVSEDSPTCGFVEEQLGLTFLCYKTQTFSFLEVEVGSRVARRMVLCTYYSGAQNLRVWAMVTVVAAGDQTGRRVGHEDTFARVRYRMHADLSQSSDYTTEYSGGLPEPGWVVSVVDLYWQRVEVGASCVSRGVCLDRLRWERLWCSGRKA